ncbi:hypothetical protein N9Y63_02770, partial [Akkermansiaceae bacterium]|nr:hypothetical protein [Akkermansiaceae bacterium]
EEEDPETAELIKLRYFVGMTMQETADAMGLKKGKLFQLSHTTDGQLSSPETEVNFSSTVARESSSLTSIQSPFFGSRKATDNRPPSLLIAQSWQPVMRTAPTFGAQTVGRN